VESRCLPMSFEFKLELLPNSAECALRVVTLVRCSCITCDSEKAGCGFILVNAAHVSWSIPAVDSLNGTGERTPETAFEEVSPTPSL
jgi:hypothetical protein